MKKVFSAVTALVLALAMAACDGAYAANIAGIGEVSLSTQKVFVDGTPANIAGYNINGNNYFKLRDLGLTLNIGVDFDASAQSVLIDTAKGYTPDGSTGGNGEIGGALNIVVSIQKVFVDGVQVFFSAYNINGNNYFKLRDFGQALDIGVDFNAATQAVIIDTSKHYTPERSVIVNGTGSGQFSSTPIQAKYLDGSDRAREDYSQAANPAIFTEALTRGAYNAIYQTLMDKDSIIPGNNDNHINPYYDYAYSVTADHFVVDAALSRLCNSYAYETSAESIVKEIYKYPSYFICKVYHGKLYDESVRLSDPLIEQWSKLSTDREKIAAIVDYVTARINYRSGTRGGTLIDLLNATPSNPVDGVCTHYSVAVQFLCERMGIACVNILSEDHAWNEVYVDGKWLIVDATSIDLGWTDSFLVAERTRHINKYPAETLFAKELLMPMSTMK